MPKNTSESQPPKSPQNFPIVGIGASAGGLDAFKEFLQAIPEDSGMAYVLVQHLAPSHESLLPKLLSKSTHLPVYEITDDINLAPDTVYIIPENKMLTTHDGVLNLTARDLSSKKNMPIDIFFNSLGEVHKSFAIGVVFSGTGYDGTQGLKRIKEEGGITYVQNPDSAGFDGMPQSAIKAGAADFILEASEIPEHLLRIDKAYETNHAHAENPIVPKEEEDLFKSILRILRLRTGNDFSNYKEATLRRRISRRMILTKREEPEQYLNYLRLEKSEQDALFNDILIPVSYFFRDTRIFEIFTSQVLPQIIKNRSSNESIRVWTAGCSTGEEAYSLAICIHEYLMENAPHLKVQIFASDISENVITKARAANYTKQDIQNVSETRLQNYFVKTDGSYHISKVIRDMCVFAVHNFLKDPPFAKMDLITCRNVLIYLNPFLQKKAMTTFHYALRENGVLFLGKSETASSHSNLFEPIIKNQKFYTRKMVPGRFIPSNFEPIEVASPERNSVEKKKIPLEADFQKIAHNILFSKYTPPAVIINDHKEIVHFHGDTSPFLVPSPGKPNFNVLKMAREGLAFEMRNALLKSKNEDETIIREGIPLKDFDYQVTIEVIPLNDSNESHSLILFHKVEKKSEVNVKQRKTSEQFRIKQLEAEIQQIREDIRRVTEDQEASNEELQSANEELLSNSEELQTLNEELETSAEELQSNNEELISVNDELMDRQDQLTSARLYSDAIVETIREPLIILDKNMRVKSANASFYNYFKTTEQDTEGRIFYDIANGIWNVNDFKAQMENVLPLKRKVADFEITIALPNRASATLLLNASQIVNDKYSEPLILLAFEDITEHKGIAIIRESEARFNILANYAPVMLWLSGIDKAVYFVNKGWIDFRGTSFEEEIGDKWAEGIHKDDRLKSLKIYEEAFDAEKDFSMEYRLLNADGKYRWISSRGVPRYTADGTFLGYAGSCIDIDDQKNFADKLSNEVEHQTREIIEMNRELKNKNEELNSFASVASHDLKEPLRKIHMFGKMIQDREAEKLSESSRHNLERIIVSTNRMEQLVNDLLSYSQINGRELILVKTDLNELIKKVENDLKETIEESNAVIQVGELPTLGVIPTLFGQVFTNLISNAIKYSKKDTTPVITITSSAILGESILSLGADATQNYYKIAVEDNGVGFPPEVKEKVFEPFKRFHDREEYSGTGIGLAICRKIVAAQNGFIKAESEVGKGSIFTIYLPSGK